VKTKHIAETKELELAQGLREDIGGVEVARDVGDGYQFAVDMIPYPVVGTVYMLHRALMLGMFCNLNGRKIVHKEWRGP